MKKILIVEDDRNVAIGMFVHLQRAGYEVITAYDAQAGLKQCHEHQPDLVIMDVCLPAANGFDVAARIRQMLPMANKPIIFMTGSHAADFPSKAASLGVAALLEKPFSDDQLTTAVQQALGEVRVTTTGRAQS